MLFVVSNSLDQHQALCCFGPDFYPKCLLRQKTLASEELM